MSVTGPPFFLFQGNLQNRTCRKGPPLDFFSTVRLFFRKFFNVSKGSPLQVFRYFATECILINPKGSPFYIFRHCATFSERKNRKLQVFQQKILRFLSLRDSAYLRRSRLVLFFLQLHIEWVLFMVQFLSNEKFESRKFVTEF